MKQTLGAYYLLTKPGIIYGNLFAAIAGFFLASGWHVSLPLFVAMGLGLGFVIGSACVFNNYLDRSIDAKMSRTRKRALVAHTISPTAALMFATLLGLTGFGTLILRTNLLTALVAFVGWFFYVVIYGIAKRKTPLGTLVGSIPGAVPPVVGYTAVTNRLDLGTLLLFLILVAWQMPHFYAIAMYRAEDYANAGLPVLPVTSGIRTTKMHIIFWIFIFVLVSALFTLMKFTGYIYLGVMLLLGLSWAALGIKGFFAKDDVRWAKKMFFFSLIMLMASSLMLAIGRLIP